jgi:DNA-binding transcriptional MerR regulator
MTMSNSNVISAFSEDDVERLTGITIHQLRYWDRTGFFSPSLANEDRRVAVSRVYTFRDVVCLKVLNTVRNELRVPLQHLREAKDKLAHLGEDVWAKATIYILNRRVIVHDPVTERKEDAVSGQGVLQIPLEVVRGDMERAVQALRARDATTIGKIAQSRRTAANKPVIAGTRIPVKSIKAFERAGYSIDQIREQYPILTEADIRAALGYGSQAA